MDRHEINLTLAQAARARAAALEDAIPDAVGDRRSVLEYDAGLLVRLADENERMNEAFDGALQHAKKAWFSGRVGDDGTYLIGYPIEEFNAETERLRSLMSARPGNGADVSTSTNKCPICGVRTFLWATMARHLRTHRRSRSVDGSDTK